MTIGLNAPLTRRAVLTSGLLLAAGGATALALPDGTVPEDAVTQPPVAVLTGEQVQSAPGSVRPALLDKAMAALDAHGRRIKRRDRIAIADFAAPSSERRFHLVDLEGGKARSVLVAHGIGSDPEHSGWLRRFSNRDGSYASSEGAFATEDYYVGKHGRSQRLIGLDPSNDNALARAIVVHGAWYVSPEMVAEHGMVGRSQGCFAVADDDLADVFRHLGPGRMIYAAKV